MPSARRFLYGYGCGTLARCRAREAAPSHRAASTGSGRSALIGLGWRMATVEPDDELAGGLLGGPRADATVLRMLGNQLRRLREAVGVTPDQAGYEIRASRSKISRMENGRVGFKGRDVAGQLTLYGVTGSRRGPGCWSLPGRPAPGLVGEVRRHPPRLVRGIPGPGGGLLGHPHLRASVRARPFQTEDYARAVTMLGSQAAPPRRSAAGWACA